MESAMTNKSFLLLIIGLSCTFDFMLFSPVPLNELDFQYHNYTVMTRYLREFANYYSEIAALETIGRSVNDRNIWVVVISAVPYNKFVGVPNIKLVANIHGDETVGREILLHFLNYLMKGYYETNDKKIQHLLNNFRIYIVPSLNPDGFEASVNGVCGNGPGRDNARHVDLNRNFPDYFRPNPIPVQPETKAMMAWMNSTKFVLSASLHGGALVVNYPFENTLEDNSDETTSPSISPDDDVFKHIATVYASNHPTMHLGEGCNKRDKFPGGIVNGAKWYKLTGGMQDYNYGIHGCMEVTLEVSCCKRPFAKELPKYFEDNVKSLVEYCLQAGHGVNGQVYDMNTKEPFRNAQLMIKGRNITFATSSSGEFFRMLLPGNFTLLVKGADLVEHEYKFELPQLPKDELPLMRTITIYLDNRTRVDFDSTEEPTTEFDSVASEENSFSPLDNDTTTENPVAICILHDKSEKGPKASRNGKYHQNIGHRCNLNMVLISAVMARIYKIL